MAETRPFDRITFEPGKMGGRACIRDLRITIGTTVGLVAEGETTEAILAACPDPSRKASTGARLQRPGGRVAGAARNHQHAPRRDHRRPRPAG